MMRHALSAILAAAFYVFCSGAALAQEKQAALPADPPLNIGGQTWAGDASAAGRTYAYSYTWIQVGAKVTGTLVIAGYGEVPLEGSFAEMRDGYHLLRVVGLRPGWPKSFEFHVPPGALIGAKIYFTGIGRGGSTIAGNMYRTR